MTWFRRQLPLLGQYILLGLLIYLKAWPMAGFAAAVSVYMSVRQALFEHYLPTRDQRKDGTK